MKKSSRTVSWLKTAKKEFQKFPICAQEHILRSLDVASEGYKSEIAKPLKGFGSGVLEIALRYQSDAYRVIYALQIDDAIWVIHAFQKKSNTGIKTPKKEINLIAERIKRLKEILDHER